MRQLVEAVITAAQKKDRVKFIALLQAPTTLQACSTFVDSHYPWLFYRLFRLEADAFVADAIAAGVNIDGYQRVQFRPLHLAILIGRPEAARSFIRAGALGGLDEAAKRELVDSAARYAEDLLPDLEAEGMVDPKMLAAIARRKAESVHSATKASAKTEKTALREAARTKAEAAKVDALLRSSAKTWAKNVEAIILPVRKHRALLDQVCTRVLSTNTAIAHPKWPAIFKKLVDQTESYGDLTEEMYGKRLSVKRILDDEGGVLDFYGDEKLHTIDLALRLLAQKAAVQHPEWEALFKHTCMVKTRCVGALSIGEDDLEMLLKRAHVVKHPAYERVVAMARKAFPFAKRSGVE